MKQSFRITFPVLPENFILEFINRIPPEGAIHLFDEFYCTTPTNICEKYSLSRTPDQLLCLCLETVDQSSTQWKEERRKRITGLQK